ncbi:EAL domain-containing protein [Neptunomonas antarctica]|uniref:PAS domain S-box-containing protein/diguanylate cyclase (GGDEF) domain-containing protein n=1 Tax=Neptunomonas antarctica TaxID=619304 RepID=A0A1N7KMD6_9GAMM|nr:EAL domain-containing protein [Neptunomonas antarctica]SIS62600.1 PAS domain S-box-containing protein/diguanylate cyclase (GGDEF) domain-containing protein [Neptunomonas antarctica]
MSYNYAQRSTLENESAILEQSTRVFAASASHFFSQSEPKLTSLAHLLEKALGGPIHPDEIKSFYQIMEQNPDGVWRNRKSGYDGYSEAGIFLPPNPQESDKQKVQHLRIKRIIDIFGAASQLRENVWYLSTNRSAIIFDRSVPEFAFDQNVDNGYTQSPWVTYTSPQLNPSRKFRFTPPLFDPVLKIWVISGLYPLYLEGQWIGALGDDMPLARVLEAMMSSEGAHPGTQHFLLDDNGNYVLAGPWQKQLESSAKVFQPDLSAEPQLATLMTSQLTDAPRAVSHEISVNGIQYVAIGVTLSPLGWKYFRMVPVDEMMAPTRWLLYALGGMIIFLTVLAGIMIGTVPGASITQRIKLLSDAMKRYSHDHSRRASTNRGGNDEITHVAQVFNSMADDIEQNIADRHQAEKALRAAQAFWRRALEEFGDGVWDLNVATREVKYSKRWKEMIGYADDELQDDFDVLENHLHADDRKRVLKIVQGYLQGSMPVYSVKFRFLCKDASYKWILARGMVFSRDADGQPLCMVGTHTDITERINAAQQLRIAATAFESQEGMLVTDASGDVLRVNSAFTMITGYAAEEAVGQNPGKLLASGRHDTAYYESLWRKVNATGGWRGEIWSRRKNGEIYPEYLTITAVKAPDKTVTNYVFTLVDITLRKAAADEIEALAFYDPLTQLPNRRLLLDRLKHALVSSRRSAKKGALLFIDLDHFKTVNDTLGHDVGDLLLKQVAERLLLCVRKNDTVARLGGDEFVVMLEGLNEQRHEAATQTEMIGNKILTTLSPSYQLGEQTYFNSCSIGIVIFCDQDDHSHEALLTQADIAMYQAKNAGRNTLRFFDPQMQASIAARAEMEHALRKAIDDQQFALYYQIQVDRLSNPLGAEALIRWNHPEKGLISPAEFIDLAEETNLIIPIGRWVLETACAQIKAWQKSVQFRRLTLSVNVSAKQFNQHDFVSQVSACIQGYEINPGLLKLELTESMLLNNIDTTIEKMNALQAIGIRFSLDDFGTGYSSLQYLKRLPLSQLKIDISFVRDIAIDENDRIIVRTIIAMAKSLNLNIIAEGVETEEQQRLLFNKGCINYQGYLFGHPVKIEEFEALLSRVV